MVTGNSGKLLERVTGRGEESDPLAEDTVVDALRNHRRRYALYYLQNNEPPVAYDELVEQVAAWENDATPEEITPTQRKSVYSALHQRHLPALEELGLVTYDRSRKRISVVDEAREFELELAVDLHTTLAWSWVYLGIALAGCGLLAAVWLGSSPFSALSSLTVAGLIVGGFGVASLCHALDVVRWRQRVAEMPPDIHFRRKRNAPERK